MFLARRAAISLTLVAALLFVGSLLVGSERSSFLVDDPPAQWIGLDRELSLKQLPYKTVATGFAIAFELAESAPQSLARLGATGDVEVFLDGQPVFAKQYGSETVADWSDVELPALAQGEHELMIVVSRADGPLLVSFHAPALALYTTRNWQGWRPGQAMGRVRVASDRAWLSIRQQSPSVWQSLAWPAGLLLLVALAAGYFLAQKNPGVSSRDELLLQPWRWVFHGAWLLLAVLSFLYLPATVRGFDYPAHIAYVQFIAERGALPLAADGWQMFQAPLFYLLGAALYRVGLLFGDIQFAADLVRLIPLACGFVHIEVAYRLARLLFPQRLKEQLVLMLVAVFTPMHLYMSQYTGNEPLAAALTAVAILLVCQMLVDPLKALSARRQLALGGVVGAAILAKISAALLAPAMLVGFLMLARREQFSSQVIALAAARISGMVVLVCGWFFARNLMELGAPVVNGWSDSRSINWWQDPGYRTLTDFYFFGYSLINPVFASAFGLWDSLYSSLWFDGFLGGLADYRYRPPWNYALALPVVWLSLLPTLLILSGLAKTVRGVDEALALPLLFSLTAVLTYLVAIAYLYATLPIYSTAKATYAMGLLPCLGLLAAVGYGHLAKIQVLRPVLPGLVLAWALLSFLAYLPVSVL